MKISMQKVRQQPVRKVVLLPISQATTATFTDLYIRNTALFFIESGSKWVQHAGGLELEGQAGDILIFPPDSVVTIENRAWSGSDYRATGVTFADDLVRQVFTNAKPKEIAYLVQVVSPSAEECSYMLDSIRNTLANDDLPEAVFQHRLLEPLVWLRALGVELSSAQDNSPQGRVRALIEKDLMHPWRSKEVAEHFAMSEPTMRRWLAQVGQSFSKILIDTRLETGLSLLQTTDFPISQIALDCGFKTPSHFSDSFKARFGITPRAIRSAKT